jgi:Zn-dependent M28 family amino/carboxypeptidase
MKCTVTAAGLALAACIACSTRGDARGEQTREMDGARALSYVEQQLAFGPRVPNTEGHRRMGDWLAAELAARADTVIVQSWTHTTKRGDRLALRNFFARIKPDAQERVLFVAHWDTRPRADQDRNLANQRLPVPGANDGASGVAVLLGVADALKTRPPAYGVDLLFVDGEDWGDFADSTESLIGSRYFAQRLPQGYAPLFAVVVDMVGDRDPQFYYEGNSENGAPEVVRRVWQTAERIGYGGVFIDGVRHTLTDDHVPLLEAGIHAIDIIDFDYPYWHTRDDTLDKVSGETLAMVGNVLIALVR